MTVIVTAPEYLQSPLPSLWRTKEDGDLFEWTESTTTAAFAKQMGAVCNEVIKQSIGLPPFTALLFVVSSMTLPWRRVDTISRLRQLQHSFEPSGDPAVVEQLADWLIALNKLPTEIRSGTASQASMIADLMSQSPSLSNIGASGAVALDAIHWLNLPTSERPLISVEQITSEKGCREAWNVLLNFSRSRIDVDQLLLKRKTGLSILPKIEPEEAFEIPASKTFQELLHSLKEDQELGPMVKMALSIAATLTLPRKPSDPDVLPIGGVSDIVNKGNPERLLATELAADPMLLMARIATGQALYIRRESPPSSQPQLRPVLIEAGVRTWGMTRVRCSAMALAVASSEEIRRGEKLDFYTVAGGEVIQEDLVSRAGIVEHFARLKSDEHPGKAIASLVAEWKEKSDEIAEPLIIISHNSDNDPDYQASLRDFSMPHLVAKIDREGWMNLVRRSASGDELLQKISLIPPKEQKHLGISDTKLLPLFLQLQEPPLRLPMVVNGLWASLAPGPITWSMTRSRTLVYFDTKSKGGREVVSALPQGNLVAHCPLPRSTNEGGIRLLFEGKQRWVVDAHVNGFVNMVQLQSLTFPPSTYDMDEDNIWQHSKNEVCRWNPVTGKLVARDSSRGTHIGPRAQLGYSSGGLWLASSVGSGIQWQEWKDIQLPLTRIACLVWSTSGFPVVIQKDLNCAQVGDLNSRGGMIDTNVEIRSKMPPKVIMQSSDRDVFVIELRSINHTSMQLSNRDHVWVALSLIDGSVDEIQRDYHQAICTIHKQHPGDIRNLSVRSKLSDIGFLGNRILIRKGPSSSWMVLATEGRTPYLHSSSGFVPQEKVEFSEPYHPKCGNWIADWSLRHAILKGGDAWLDSRGMLHLRRRSDGTELSLVLHDSHLAGWHSSGETFGPSYFLTKSEQQVFMTDSVKRWLEEFALQCQ